MRSPTIYNIWVIVLLIITSCKPVVDLQVRPDTICPGDDAWLVYTAKDVKEEQITAEPPLDFSLPSEIQGIDSIRINPRRTTTFTLSAKDGSTPLSASATVRVLEPGESEFRNYDFRWGGCEGSSAGEHLSINEITLGEGLKIQTVTNNTSRRIRLTHKGSSADLEPRSSTSAFNGLSVRGTWAAQLLDINTVGIRNEGCPPRTRTTAEIFNDPPSINISVTYSCD